jgi:hypothetical protein
MKGIVRYARLAAIGLIAASGFAAAAQQAPAIEDRIINSPSVRSISIQGLRAAPKPRKDAGVQAGEALRVAVPGKSDQPWTIAASTPIQKPVKAGDEIVLAFWARLEKGAEGATTATLPYNAVQLSSAPYTPLFNGPAEIGPEWKMHEIRGKADKDYPAGALVVSMHLATGKQTVDLGPVFVLDMGAAN